MMQLQTYPNPTQLWLAAAAAQSDEPEPQHAGSEETEARSLRILIVEDEFFISLDTKALLKGLGHTVVAIAVSADEAVRMADKERPDVVLMDIRLIGARDGIDAAAEIQRRFAIPSIFVTANTDAATRARAQAVGPVAFLEKPLTEPRLRAGLMALGGK
jgi:two-component system, response regulator PdtaR